MQGKTQLTRRVRFSLQSTYARHTLLAGGPRTWQPFVSRQQCWTDTTAPEKKYSRLHLSARLSGPWDCLSFSPNPANEAVGLSQASVDDRLLGLLGT
jgi:hypothetical protein